jgi:hypothetical protein
MNRLELPSWHPLSPDKADQANYNHNPQGRAEYVGHNRLAMGMLLHAL